MSKRTANSEPEGDQQNHFRGQQPPCKKHRLSNIVCEFCLFIQNNKFIQEIENKCNDSLNDSLSHLFTSIKEKTIALIAKINELHKEYECEISGQEQYNRQDQYKIKECENEKQKVQKESEDLVKCAQARYDRVLSESADCFETTNFTTLKQEAQEELNACIEKADAAVEESEMEWDFHWNESFGFRDVERIQEEACVGMEGLLEELIEEVEIFIDDLAATYEYGWDQTFVDSVSTKIDAMMEEKESNHSVAEKEELARMKNEYEKYLATKRQEIGMIWSRNVDEERKDAIALLKDATKTSFPSKWSCTDPL